MEIRIEQVESRHAAAVDYRVELASIGQAMGAAIGEVAAVLGEERVEPAGMPFSLYPRGAPDERGMVAVVTGMPVDSPIIEVGRVRNYDLPGGMMAIGTHVGPYDAIASSYGELEQAAREAGYEPSGPMWECYLADPASEPDASKWRTDICVPVTAAIPPD